MSKMKINIEEQFEKFRAFVYRNEKLDPAQLHRIKVAWYAGIAELFAFISENQEMTPEQSQEAFMSIKEQVEEFAEYCKGVKERRRANLN